jgi:hypothetical protein
MADLGDNGKLMRVGPWMRQAPAGFASDQSPNNVVIGPILASAPYVIAILYRRGVEVDKTRADASGNFYFYDYDDSGYSPYTIKAFTRYGAVGTGEEWQVDIAYPTVTITKLFGASRGGAYFYQG